MFQKNTSRRKAKFREEGCIVDTSMILPKLGYVSNYAKNNQKNTHATTLHKKNKENTEKKERLNLFNSKMQFLPGYQGDLDQH